MYRKVLIALLILFALIMTASAVTMAQDTNPKQLRSLFGMTAVCWEPPCNLGSVTVSINPPEKTPDKYRVSWKIEGKKWLSWKKPNTSTRGNAFIDGDSVSYRITGIRIPYGETLRIRVRAIYESEKNGPWMCCLEAGHGND